MSAKASHHQKISAFKLRYTAIFAVIIMLMSSFDIYVYLTWYDAEFTRIVETYDHLRMGPHSEMGTVLKGYVLLFLAYFISIARTTYWPLIYPLIELPLSLSNQFTEVVSHSSIYWESYLFWRGLIVLVTVKMVYDMYRLKSKDSE